MVPSVVQTSFHATEAMAHRIQFYLAPEVLAPSMGRPEHSARNTVSGQTLCLQNRHVPAQFSWMWLQNPLDPLPKTSTETKFEREESIVVPRAPAVAPGDAANRAPAAAKESEQAGLLAE